MFHQSTFSLERENIIYILQKHKSGYVVLAILASFQLLPYIHLNSTTCTKGTRWSSSINAEVPVRKCFLFSDHTQPENETGGLY